jgi:hypothetical protein
MKIRILKIAVSAVSVFACLLLVVLWVRSHWIADTLRWHGSATAGVTSREGAIRISWRNDQFMGAPIWQWYSTGSPRPDGLGSWYFRCGHNSMFIVFPYRLPIVVLVLTAVVPWIRWHYSLRAVLIVVTMISLVLSFLLYPVR